eukprot:6213678-Pleurochrysis_carterae.AAC.8
MPVKAARGHRRPAMEVQSHSTVHLIGESDRTARTWRHGRARPGGTTADTFAECRPQLARPCTKFLRGTRSRPVRAPVCKPRARGETWEGAGKANL